MKNHTQHARGRRRPAAYEEYIAAYEAHVAADAAAKAVAQPTPVAACARCGEPVCASHADDDGQCPSCHTCSA